MTLTLDIPPDLDAAKRERLAVALYDANLISQDEAAQITGPSDGSAMTNLGEEKPLPQGSPEWKARLRSDFRAETSLRDEQTRRESIYGDDLRDTGAAERNSPPLDTAQWDALLRRLAETGPRNVALSIEATSRESIYGDEGR